MVVLGLFYAALDTIAFLGAIAWLWRLATSAMEPARSILLFFGLMQPLAIHGLAYTGWLSLRTTEILVLLSFVAGVISLVAVLSPIHSRGAQQGDRPTS
jgi:hypothetical protein